MFNLASLFARSILVSHQNLLEINEPLPQYHNSWMYHLCCWSFNFVTDWSDLLGHTFGYMRVSYCLLSNFMMWLEAWLCADFSYSCVAVPRVVVFVFVVVIVVPSALIAKSDWYSSEPQFSSTSILSLLVLTRWLDNRELGEGTICVALWRKCLY